MLLLAFNVLLNMLIPCIPWKLMKAFFNPVSTFLPRAISILNWKIPIENIWIALPFYFTLVLWNEPWFGLDCLNVPKQCLCFLYFLNEKLPVATNSFLVWKCRFLGAYHRYLTECCFNNCQRFLLGSCSFYFIPRHTFNEIQNQIKKEKNHK